MFELFVEGEPVPQGSMRAFPVGGRCVVTSDNPRLKAWRETVTQAVLNELDRRRDDEALHDLARKDAALWLQLTFYMPRPKTVKRSRPTVAPDLDKLIRAVKDALSDARLWYDDANVVAYGEPSKWYADGVLRPGVEISVRELS